MLWLSSLSLFYQFSGRCALPYSSLTTAVRASAALHFGPRMRCLGTCRVQRSLLGRECDVRACAGCHPEERYNLRSELAYIQYHPVAYCIDDLYIAYFDLVAVIAHWLARRFRVRQHKVAQEITYRLFLTHSVVALFVKLKPPPS